MLFVPLLAMIVFTCVQWLYSQWNFIVHISCSGVCVSRCWPEHCGQRARDQCWRWNAQFICAHRHRHNHKSGPAVDGSTNPHLLPGVWTEWFHWQRNHDTAGITAGPVWYARSQLFFGVCFYPPKFRNSRASTWPHPPVQTPQPPYTRWVCEWRWRCWCVSKFVCLSSFFFFFSLPLHVRHAVQVNGLLRT